MWRPKDWKNPFNIAAVYARGNDNKPISHNEAYEYGADAILEALMGLATESPTGTFTFDSRVVNIFRGKIK